MTKTTVKEKIKVYVYDWGDTPLYVTNPQDIADMIKESIIELEDDREFSCSVTIKYMTKRQLRNVPEWS